MIIEPPVAILTREGALLACYGTCTAEQAEQGLTGLQPQPLAPLVKPVELDGGIDEIDRYYVLCTEDKAIPPALQRRMSRESPCAEIVEIACDHSPFLSATSELAAAFDRFARA